ncbi:hypothetical protein H920_02452 [Fukomys damarensis]|uniref:Uncharacterized protein n=1 Tax=Fukomys damarensis TaxID=885580 RepID=A0A091E043_FUKDA|nr:hypothetical protein H920_02452 [Fukomys damarensis]
MLLDTLRLLGEFSQHKTIPLKACIATTEKPCFVAWHHRSLCFLFNSKELSSIQLKQQREVLTLKFCSVGPDHGQLVRPLAIYRDPGKPNKESQSVFSLEEGERREEGRGMINNVG